MGAAERPQRKGQRGQQAVDQRQEKFARMHCGHERQRNDGAEGPGNDERQNRAERHADQAAGQRQQQHLGQIDRENTPPRCAKGFQRGDHFAAAVEMAFHRIANANAADQQRGQSDDGEELREAIDVALELWRGVLAIADFPAGFRQLLARIGRHGNGRFVGALRQAQPVDPAHQTAGLQQAGCAQRVFTHQQARAEADAARKLIRLTRECCANFYRGAADGERRAGFDVEPCKERRIGGGAERAVPLRQNIG